MCFILDLRNFSDANQYANMHLEGLLYILIAFKLKIWNNYNFWLLLSQFIVQALSLHNYSDISHS